MCPHKYVNHISNVLVEQTVDDLGLIFFLKQHNLGSIGIPIWELNKVHYMSVQFMGDKENKKMVQNRLKSFTRGSLVHPCTISTFLFYS